MHTPAVPRPCVLGQDRAGWDEEPLLSPGAGSGSHPCQLGSVLLPGMAPSQNPVCLPPHGHPQPFPWAQSQRRGLTLPPPWAPLPAGLLQPSPSKEQWGEPALCPQLP